MKLSKEDVKNFATEDEKVFLEAKPKAGKLGPGWTPEMVKQLKFSVKMQNKRRADAKRMKDLKTMTKAQNEDIEKYGTDEEKKVLNENARKGEFKILIETNNEAFFENPIDEIERVITDGIQSHLADFMHNEIGTTKLIDSNGNSCGFIEWNFKRNW